VVRLWAVSHDCNMGPYRGRVVLAVAALWVMGIGLALGANSVFDAHTVGRRICYITAGLVLLGSAIVLLREMQRIYKP
jgi:hypothetical protein